MVEGKDFGLAALPRDPKTLVQAVQGPRRGPGGVLQIYSLRNFASFFYAATNCHYHCSCRGCPFYAGNDG